MKDQHGISTKLGHRSEVVSIYKCSPEFFGTPLHRFGEQKLPHSTLHIPGTKRLIDKSKCHCQSTMCP